MRSYEGRLPRLGLLVAAVLAISAISASAAQAANWYWNGGKLPTGQPQNIETKSGNAPGLVTMEIPTRNLKVTCKPDIFATIVGPDVMYDFDLSLFECKAYSLSKGTELNACVQGTPNPAFSYSGTGGQISTTDVPKLIWPECQLPKNNPLNIPSLSLSYAYPEAFTQEVTGSVSGQYGLDAQPMTVSYKLNMVPYGSVWWGYH
jgi:hypothetical protein